MSVPVVFRREARIEFDGAADWYQQRQSGLGRTFTRAVQRVLERISSRPDF